MGRPTVSAISFHKGMHLFFFSSPSVTTPTQNKLADSTVDQPSCMHQKKIQPLGTGTRQSSSHLVSTPDEP